MLFRSRGFWDGVTGWFGTGGDEERRQERAIVTGGGGGDSCTAAVKGVSRCVREGS